MSTAATSRPHATWSDTLPAETFAAATRAADDAEREFLTHHDGGDWQGRLEAITRAVLDVAAPDIHRAGKGEGWDEAIDDFGKSLLRPLSADGTRSLTPNPYGHRVRMAVRRASDTRARAHVSTPRAGLGGGTRALCDYVVPAHDAETLPWDSTAPEDRCQNCVNRLPEEA